MSQLLLKSLELRPICLYTKTITVRCLTSDNSGKTTDDGKANQAQLYNIELALQEHVPKFFSYSHPYGYYSSDMVFNDNIRGVKLQGLTKYATRINLIKIYFTLRYSSNRMELLNLVKNPEESFIKVRWRIKSKPVFKTYLGKEIWNDGISTFHVNSNGKICSHICDNVQTDTKESLVFKRINDTLIKS